MIVTKTAYNWLFSYLAPSKPRGFFDQGSARSVVIMRVAMISFAMLYLPLSFTFRHSVPFGHSVPHFPPLLLRQAQSDLQFCLAV